MAAVALADMTGIYTADTAEMLGCFQAAGIRIDTILNALAPYEATANDVPTPIAQWGGVYTIDTAAKRDMILAAAGIRAQSFWQKFIAFKA